MPISSLTTTIFNTFGVVVTFVAILYRTPMWSLTKATYLTPFEVLLLVCHIVPDAFVFGN